jgi:poly(3-hydroxyalkanoate) synthetase
MFRVANAALGNQVADREDQSQPSTSKNQVMQLDKRRFSVRMISQGQREKTDRPERKFQRYFIDYDGATIDQIQVTVQGEPVHLVNYSLGGLYFLSVQRYYAGDLLNISIDIKSRAKMELVGTVVQVRIEEGAWGIALEFSKSLESIIQP